MAAQDDISNFEVSTSAEVHFTGKENIEGFVSLVNLFLRTMLSTSTKPCLINVNNIDGTFKDLRMEDGQVFYHSSMDFKQSFTALLGKKVKNLQTITVQTSYSSIQSYDISAAVANRIGNKTFAYVGLKPNVKV